MSVPFIRVTARPWFWFAVSFLLFGLHVFTSRFHTQVYDANGYRELSYRLYNDGDFTLLRFDSALRGYLYPLLYVPVVALANAQSLLSEEALIKLIGAAVAGVTFGLLPALLWQRVTGARPTPLRQALFLVAGFALWRDYFNYMLTDFPAVAGLVWALCLLLPHPTLSRSLLAGFLVATVINMRPIYLVALPPMLTVGSWLAWHDMLRPWAIAIGRFSGAFAMGFLLLNLPQWYINREIFGINRPLVIGTHYTDPSMVGGSNLYLQKINDGFIIQKYETSVSADYSNPQVHYLDPSGATLLSLDSNQRINSYRKYLRFVLAHPLDMIVLNARHLFNGLDVLYPTPYIHRVYTSTAALAWFNYTLLFAAGVLLLRRGQRLTATQYLLVLPLLLPAIMAIPMPMECRYVLPLHLVLIAGACFGWPAEWYWRKLPSERRYSLLAGYVAFLVVCFTLSANTQALLAAAPKLLTP